LSRKRLPAPEAIRFDELTTEKSGILSRVIGKPPRDLPDVRYIPIEYIERDSEQPRQHFDVDKLNELAESIRVRGIEQPLVVLKAEEGYRLIGGERRWRAAQLAGLREVPILAYRSLSDAEVDEYQINEFLLHEAPSPIEKARFLKAYKERNGKTWNDLSAMLGISTRSILHLVAVVDAPDRVKEMIEDGDLSVTQYREMKSLPEEIITPFAEKVARDNIPAREIKAARETFLDDINGTPKEDVENELEFTSQAQHALKTTSNEETEAVSSTDFASEPENEPKSTSQQTELSTAVPIPMKTPEAKLTAKISKELQALARYRAIDLGLPTVADYVRWLLEKDLRESGRLKDAA
jgi:ParB family chromosome partitioning protein